VILAAGLIGFVGASRNHPAFTGGGGHGGKSSGDAAPALLSDAPFEQSPAMRRDAHRAALACGVLWLAPVALIVALLGAGDVFSQIAIFFSKMAVVTFGGAYAVLAYVAQQAVEGFHWLKPGEMLDGLGMAETTPGPLIMVLQFVGFMGAFRASGALAPLTAGVLGGLLATWVTFTPCFLWIFLGAPYIERLRDNKALAGALGAITAAVVGVILNLAVWFAIHTLFGRVIEWHGVELPDPASVNVAALVLSLGAAVAVFYLKAGMLKVLGACALAGVAAYFAGLIS
jgi:chromate transporter